MTLGSELVTSGQPREGLRTLGREPETPLTANLRAAKLYRLTLLDRLKETFPVWGQERKFIAIEKSVVESLTKPENNPSQEYLDAMQTRNEELRCLFRDRVDSLNQALEQYLEEEKLLPSDPRGLLATDGRLYYDGSEKFMEMLPHTHFQEVTAFLRHQLQTLPKARLCDSLLVARTIQNIQKVLSTGRLLNCRYSAAPR